MRRGRAFACAPVPWRKSRWPFDSKSFGLNCCRFPVTECKDWRPSSSVSSSSACALSVSSSECPPSLSLPLHVLLCLSTAACLCLPLCLSLPLDVPARADTSVMGLSKSAVREASVAPSLAVRPHVTNSQATSRSLCQSLDRRTRSYQKTYSI